MRTRAAVLTVLTGAALAVPAAPAAAAACATDSGVTVVVDFASLGGGTSRQCAPGDPASGVAALHAAGFTTTRAAQQPGYFMCRINGKPANDPCQRTSPADAYWSYWHAKPGGTWTYSSIGPADYDPAPGTVEGWAFGAGKPPSSPPPHAAVAPTPARPTPKPTPASVSSPQAATSSPPVVSRSTPPPAHASAAPSPSRSATPTPTPTPSATEAAPAPDLADPPSSGRGAATGPVLAGVVIALLLAVAAGTAMRRRRSDA